MNRSEEDRLPRIVCEAGGGVVVGLEGLGPAADQGHALYRVEIAPRYAQPMPFRPLIQGGDVLEIVAEHCIGTGAMVAWAIEHHYRDHVPPNARFSDLDLSRDVFLVLRSLLQICGDPWVSTHLIPLADAS